MTLANWAGDRCSRLRASRFLMPYSGSPDRPRRPYLPRTTRRRTSPVGLDGQVHDVEQVRGELRARQHPAHRGGVDASTCRSRRPGPRPARPGRPAPASTRRHRRCGPPPGPAAPAPRTGQRSRCATGRRAAGTPRSAHRSANRGRPRRCSSMPRCATGAAGLLQHRVRGGGERLMRDRPGDPGVPGRLRRGDPALARPRCAACSRSRAVIRHRGGSLRHPLGERLAQRSPGCRTSTGA